MRLDGPFELSGTASSLCIFASNQHDSRPRFGSARRGLEVGAWLATIGRNRAIADIHGRSLSGFPAWVAWLFIHIMYLIGFRNRLVVMLQWMWAYFSYQRAIRLITGNR